MRVDSRGRVRFTYNNIRYDVTKRGLRMYLRGSNYEESLSHWYGFNPDFTEPELLEKLRQALNAVHDHYVCILRTENDSPFTRNIIVPKRKAGEF